MFPRTPIALWTHLPETTLWFIENFQLARNLKKHPDRLYKLIDHPEAVHILDLNTDVQWRILLMNADMDASLNHGALYEPGKGSPHFRYSPLTVTRRTSQVCRFWRNLLLYSPSIWSRVFHLDLLDQKTPDWRIEVLRRTAKSPLCITGEVTGIAMEDFFFALLDQEWSRIRRIDVRIHNEWEFEDDDVWEPLTRPTSVLESFDLCLSGDTSFPPRFKTKLFGNKAPSLTEFHPNNIKFSLQAPWVSQLRYLEVSHPFTVLEIIETMKRMSFLDTLVLGRGVRPVQLEPDMDDFPQVSMPVLRNIELTCLVQTAVQFLDHVIPGRGCGLSFTSTDLMPFTTLDQQELEALSRVLAQCADNYFSVYPPKRLLFNITDRFFYLCDLLDPSRSPSSPTFKITIDTGIERSPSKSFLSNILTSLSPSAMSSLTTLDLLLDSDSVDPTDANFIRLLYSFTSLEVLQLNSLDLLAQLQQLPRFKSVLFPMNLDVLFPNLRTLKIVLSVEIPENPLRAFLIWRNMIGVKIQTLDLTFSSPDLLGDLRFLDEFDGIRVIWSGHHTIEEYMCGSRDPSRLDFRVRRGTLATWDLGYYQL